jgi:hypothetical protein
MVIKLFVAIGIVLVVTGCGRLRHYNSPISSQAKYDINRPVDCASAQADIQTLSGEKASSAEQAKSGVKMIVPAAAARGILHGDYMDRAQVAIGEYNAAIDAKIMKIKSTCGIQ